MSVPLLATFFLCVASFSQLSNAQLKYSFLTTAKKKKEAARQQQQFILRRGRRWK